ATIQNNNKYTFAPGENHIALQTSTQTYYVPEVFHLAPTSISVPPLFIHDITTSPPLSQIYFRNASYLNVIIINNFPISKLRIAGRIIGEVYRSSRADPSYDFILLRVDDCSGDGIWCKVPILEYSRSGLRFDSNYGKLIEITGKVSTWANKREVHAETVNIIGGNTDISAEIDCWKERMEYRKEILEPGWVFIPEATSQGDVVVRFDTQETNKRQSRAELLLSDEIQENTGKTSSDSMNLYQNEDTCMMIVDNETQIKIFTNLQLAIEMIKWIIANNFVEFKLATLFYDQNIANLLDILTRNQLAAIEIPNHENLTFKQARKVVFQRIRHDLQINMNLISVTKSQKVYSNNLQKLYTHLKTCLSRIRQRGVSNEVLDVVYYLSVVKHRKVIGDGLGYKIVNAIIDYIIVDDLHDRDSWHYDPRNIQWSYIGDL
ncbi:uncharacterized protein SPAPADRAFT_137615, partial [Spathaspora passalidarum NRRL Y-27907]